MTAADVLRELEGAGVTLEARGDDRLGYSAPQGVMTSERAALARRFKAELIAILGRRRTLDDALAACLTRNAGLRALDAGLADSVEQVARERHAAGCHDDLRDLLDTISRCVANARSRHAR